jgi:phage shock protein A
MEKMADSNSKALIQALQEVIRDFNTKLSEQFGDNFKQLNAAVGKLLTWQEQYRVQLIELVEQQTATSKNMKAASENYENLVEKAEVFSAISTQLATMLTELAAQRSQIEQSLRSLGQLLTTASESLPQVQNKIMDLTQQMTFGVKSHQEEITKAIRDGSIVLQGTVGDVKKELAEATQATHQQISTHAKNLSDGVQTSQTEITNVLKNTSTALQQAVADVKKVLLEAAQSANQELNAHVKHISEETSKEVVKLDQALERELTKAITTMGSQLTSLSKQFVDDYTPLTERLRDLIRSVGAK